LLGLFDQLLADAAWLIPWGLLGGCAALFVIGLGGFFARSRWLAGLCVAALGIGSTVILLAITVNHSNASLGQLRFLIPGLVAAGIGLWFALTERPRRHNATSTT